MTEFQRAEMKRFSAAGKDFASLIPSSSVVGLDEVTVAILEGFQDGPRNPASVVDSLSGRFSHDDLVDGLSELHQIGAITTPEHAITIPPYRQMKEPPLSTLVLNVTNKCNLSCKYCYEYGEDKLAAPAATRFMDERTAFESVEFLLKRGAHLPRLTLTFFGGETLLNFKVVRSTVEYARRRGREAGKTIDFSLTTNATLLTEEIIGFLSENHVGVTISIDGPKELQDRFRTFHNGAGSYDQILPRIKSLLTNHRTRPVGARVTLTAQVMDVIRIFDHLTGDIGFYEVGFASVTTSADTLYSIGGKGFDSMLDQFTTLGARYLEKAVKGEYLGFSNMSDSLQEIHTGVTKSYACGAGLGLLGVSPAGDISLCHWFVDSPDHKLGNIRTGIDEQKRHEFNERTHLSKKVECHTCWVRGMCSGGCYHEAQVRYGDIGHANLHYCDWIRGWTAVAAAIRDHESRLELYAVKIFDRSFATEIESVVKALEWCAGNQMDVVNLSLGTAKTSQGELLKDPSRRVKILIAPYEFVGLPAYPGLFPWVFGVSEDPSCTVKNGAVRLAKVFSRHRCHARFPDSPRNRTSAAPASPSPISPA